MNADNNQSFAEDSAAEKKDLFDAVEIKGLSAKSARAFSMGRFARMLRFISRLLAFTTSRVYGLMFLSFGVLTLFLHLGEYYFMDDPRVQVSSLVIGAVFALLSIFLLISDKPICIALQSVKIIDFIVFDFFSINRMQGTGTERRLSGAVGIIVGFLLSVLGFFLPTEYAALVFVGLIFFAVAMVSPEFPYIFSLLIFPYLSLIPNSSILFAALIALTVISFARKVLVGKRIYSLEIYDFLFLFFIIAVLICGAILGKGESANNSLIIIIFALGYIPASNMAVNRRLFDCISGAVVASSIPVCLYSIVRYAIELFAYERKPARAFFSSPEIFAVYLTVVALFSLYLSLKRSRIVKKRYYFAAFVLSILAVLTTECFAVPMALLLLILTLFAIRSRKLSYCWILLFITVPMLLFLLGSTALSWISENLSVSPSLVLRKESILLYLDFFAKNFFLGGGVGGDFARNVYLGIACRFGILAIMAFLILIVLRVFHIGIHKKYFSDSTVNFYVELSTLATVSILIFGSYADIFADPEMLYMFISVFATGSAALRVSRKEKEEQLSYYKDLGTSDSAAIDVSIK